jgi:putative ABC transport system permease protein
VTGPVSGWRTALRIARREARRARGRSVLVIAMIMLPVAALAFAAVTYDSFTLTPDERADRLMGSAQALVTWPYDGPAAQDPAELLSIPLPGATAQPDPPTRDRLLALLPSGSRALDDVNGHLTVHTAAGTGTVGARMLDYTDPLARGVYRQVSGTAPSTVDEVALTPAAARRLGTGLGGTVRLADGSRTFHVVGIVEDRDHLNFQTIVLRPGAVPAAGFATDRADLHWLVATPGALTWTDVKRLNTSGIVAVSRQVLAHPPGEAERYHEFRHGDDVTAGILVLVVGLAMLETVLLAGPAFAVGARRRRRDLALVAAAGATPAHLRRIVLADGVVLGAMAAAGGIVLGVLVAAVFQPVLEVQLANVRAGAFRVFPTALAGLAVLAVVTGLLAALVPAWIASRQDVVSALAGRRGITRSRRRWVALGLLLILAGAGTSAVGAWRINTTVILTGLVVVEMGLVLCTPAVVGLVARLGRWLPLAPRIALRDTSRNRTTAAPAVAAVLAAVIGSVAVGVVLTAADARAVNDYRTSGRPGDVGLYSDKAAAGSTVPPETLATVRGIIPVASVHNIGVPSCGGGLCAVDAQLPADLDCPYSSWRLQHRPTAAEQRAARRDHRCDGVGRMTSYFGGGIGSARGLTVIIEPDAAAAVTNLPAGDTDQAIAALRAGKVVVDDPRYVHDGQVTLAVMTPRADGTRGGDIRTVTAPGFALAHRPEAPITMMTEPTALSLGFTSQPFVTLVTTSRMPTVAEQDRLQAALGDRYHALVDQRPEPNTANLVVLAIVAGIITLGAAAIATGLAAADGRSDLATLAAVGASPRLRRALSLSQSGVIAGLGSLIGTVAGLGASIAVLAALNQRFADVWPAPTPYPLGLPWFNVAVALVVVPVVAMLGAGLLTRSRLPIERRL